MSWTYYLPQKLSRPPLPVPPAATRLVLFSSQGPEPWDCLSKEWSTLRAAPYGFTIDSSVLSGEALVALIGCLDGQRVAKEFSVQCTANVLVISMSAPPSDERPVDTRQTEIVAWKRTVGQHRLLVLAVRHDASSSDEVLDAFLKFQAPPTTSQHAVLCQLDALLSWLRTAIRTSSVSDPSRASIATASDTTSNWTLSILSPDIVLSLLMPAARPTSHGGHATTRAMPSTVKPTDTSVPSLTTRIPADDSNTSRAACSVTVTSLPASRSSDTGVSLAIIVPFRDQPLQNRAEQLKRFAEFMPLFLQRSPHPVRDFHIVVAEQTDDGYKFNRAKLLNAGYLIATDPARRLKYGLHHDFTAFCFHDVDLHPKDASGIAEWYSFEPEPMPIHIAAAWSRYPYDKYVGGILTMSARHMAITNGFPNNFWGWGGEDDELSLRLERKGLFPPRRPPPGLTGTISDIEDELILERGSHWQARASNVTVCDCSDATGMITGIMIGPRLPAAPGPAAGIYFQVRIAGTTVTLAGGKRAKSAGEWKNLWKTEMRMWHHATGHSDGLSTCRYDVLRQRSLSPSVTVFSIDLHAEDDPCATRLTDVEILDTNSDNYERFLRRALPAGTKIPPPPEKFVRGP